MTDIILSGDPSLEFSVIRTQAERAAERAEAAVDAVLPARDQALRASDVTIGARDLAVGAAGDAARYADLSTQALQNTTDAKMAALGAAGRAEAAEARINAVNDAFEPAVVQALDGVNAAQTVGLTAVNDAANAGVAAIGVAKAQALDAVGGARDAAVAAKVDAVAARDVIRAKILPAAGADPTVDEGGQPVRDGATYWSTALSRMRQRVAGVWRTLNTIILSTTGAPAAGTGADGDFAIDAAGKVVYGPKAGGTWPAGVGLGGMVLKRVDVLTSSGSYIKQGGDTLYRVIVIGAGGGGGAGAKLSTNGAVVAGGGAGGAGGSINVLYLNAADLPASVTYVIGAGGSGGAAISTAATAGAAGSAGGSSRFDNSISAGGAGGAGGSLTTVPTDTASGYGYVNSAIMADPGSNIVNYNKGQGGAAGNTYIASPGTTGGGCGQHVYNAGAYGSAASCRSGIAGLGQPSSAAGVNAFGGAGSAGVTTSRGNGCGSGGGGGSAAVTGAAGNGGSGGNYGGGGGGGGAGMDAASAGGAGGAGAPGCIIVFVYG